MMEYVFLAMAALVGFALGVLFGRRNRVKVEEAVAIVKKEYQEKMSK